MIPQYNKRKTTNFYSLRDSRFTVQSMLKQPFYVTKIIHTYIFVRKSDIYQNAKSKCIHLTYRAGKTF